MWFWVSIRVIIRKILNINLIFKYNNPFLIAKQLKRTQNIDIIRGDSMTSKVGGNLGGDYSIFVTFERNKSVDQTDNI